ncbi:MAG: Rnase Y domain-containing protein, partial [Patescibacteria group bacterium]
MSFTTILAFIALAGIVGIGVGYALRLLVSLGYKGSAELKIKERLEAANENAKKIVAEGEKRLTGLEDEFKKRLTSKEELADEKDRRVGQKEQYLDKRQIDIDAEAERIKTQIEEVKRIKERADGLIAERQKALEGVAKLTETEARDELMRAAEKD